MTMSTHETVTPAPAPATMTEVGRRFLRALAGRSTSGCYLEIGPLFGSSTQAIDAGRRRPAPIHTIDTFEPAPWVKRRIGRDLSRSAFDEYTAHIPDLVVHEGFAPDVVRDTWQDEIGFYFDDATHGDPGWTDNFDFFSRFFTEDAIVCGDDFAGGWPDIPRNVTRIAQEWGVGVYVVGRVWAMTRVAEERIVAAATETSPRLAGAEIEAAHGPRTSTMPAMCWSAGLHQREPLTSFRVSGDAVAGVRFTTVTADGTRAEAGAGEVVALTGVSSIAIEAPAGIGFQLCLARGAKTENTARIKPGAAFEVPPEASVVAVRLA